MILKYTQSDLQNKMLRRFIKCWEKQFPVAQTRRDVCSCACIPPEPQQRSGMNWNLFNWPKLQSRMSSRTEPVNVDPALTTCSFVVHANNHCCSQLFVCMKHCAAINGLNAPLQQEFRSLLGKIFQVPRWISS